MMKKNTIAVFVIVLIGIVLLRERDYYHWECDDITYALDYLEAEPGAYEGFVTSTGDLELKAGTYRLQINAESIGFGNYFEIIDTVWSDGIKASGKVLYTEKYTEGESEHICEFTLEEKADNLRVYSYTDGGHLDVSSYELDSVRPYFSDTWFLAILWVMLYGIFLWKHDWFVSDKARPFWILCVLSVIVSFPLITDFWAEGHDLDFHIQRVAGIAENIQRGESFPFRVNTGFNSGYGFLNPVMYPEAFLYIPGILVALNVSTMISLKFFLILVQMGTGLIAYYSMQTVFKEKTAFIFAILYLLAPYRLNNLYIRFALGEYLGMMFLPLLFAGVYHIVLGDEKKWWMAVLGCTGIIQSHILTVELSVFFVTGFLLLNLGIFRNISRLLQGIKAVAVTLVLNLWYIVPWLGFMSWEFALTQSTSDLKLKAAYLGQIFATVFSTNLDKVNGSTYQEMSLSIGPSLLIGVGIWILYYKCMVNENAVIKKFVNQNLILGIAAVYMSSTLFPWAAVYKISFLKDIFGVIQFPWRFLELATFFLSVVTACALVWCCENNQKLSYLIVGVLVYSVMIIMNGYISDSKTKYESKFSPFSNCYSEDYYKSGFDMDILNERGNVVTAEAVSVLEVENYEKEGTRISFDYAARPDDMAQEYSLTFPLYNYGLYEVKINESVGITFTNREGLLSVRIPASMPEGHVEVRYVGRKLYVLCDGISLGAILMFLVFMSKRGWIKKANNG